MIHNPGVRCGVRAWGTTDWGLVYGDHLIKVLEPFNLIKRQGCANGLVEEVLEGGVEGVVYKGTFPTT